MRSPAHAVCQRELKPQRCCCKRCCFFCRCLRKQSADQLRATEEVSSVALHPPPRARSGALAHTQRTLTCAHSRARAGTGGRSRFNDEDATADPWRVSVSLLARDVCFRMLHYSQAIETGIMPGQDVHALHSSRIRGNETPVGAGLGLLRRRPSSADGQHCFPDLGQEAHPGLARLLHKRRGLQHLCCAVA